MGFECLIGIERALRSLLLLFAESTFIASITGIVIIQVIVTTPLTQLKTALETFARSVCLQHLLLEASRLVERIIIQSLVFIEESERLLALSQSLTSLPDTFQIDNW